ncbi:cupin domain-containing protein [Actinoplanes siamensis]|uniref:Cupin n=1 Tax=Actinoplanes siamensis TaxID=1223317 RepID=A0A919NA23_9ACTN|nr:cupin domain-containing protein [Actinoplanes siamensis]GIF07067.1 cupin [Actinoplanes siamensis]
MSGGRRAVRIHVDTVAANRRRGGDIRITLGPANAGATSGFGGRLSLRPGEVVIEHCHPYSEEFLHVVSGTGTIRVDGEEFVLGPGDSLIVPIGSPHRLVNTGTQVLEAVFHLSPLAPRPALGHVDLEPPVDADAPQPAVGGTA